MGADDTANMTTRRPQSEVGGPAEASGHLKPFRPLGAKPIGGAAADRGQQATGNGRKRG